MFKAFILATVTLLLPCGVTASGPSESQKATAAVRKEIQNAPVWDFGKVRRDEVVEHNFELRNDSSNALEIKAVQLTPPLSVTGMKRILQPGETGRVDVRFGQPRSGGDFEGLIIVQFAGDNARAKFFRVQGRVVNAIDFDPLKAFFITTFKGESVQQSIDIVNYDTEPLRKIAVAGESPRFRSSLETIETGRRYRLTVRTLETAPAGKSRDVIQVQTSNPQYPSIAVPVNTQVRDRVYTFPDSLTLGLIDREDLKARPQELAFLTQSVMIYQRNGTNFEINPETDIPFLRLIKRAADTKDRYEIVAEVVPDKLTSGRFEGVIKIKTNDADFRLIDVPVIVQVR